MRAYGRSSAWHGSSPPDPQAPPGPTTITSTPQATTQYAVAPATQATIHVIPAQIAELDVTDDSDSAKTVAATARNVPTIYIFATSTSSGLNSGANLNSCTAQIDLSAVTNPAGVKIKLQVTGDGATKIDDTHFTLTPTPQANPALRQIDTYNVTAWLADANGNPLGNPQEAAIVDLVSPVEFIQQSSVVQVSPVGNSGFDNYFVAHARWTSSDAPQAAPYNPSNWVELYDQNDEATYVYDPPITTYVRALVPGDNGNWNLGEMALDTAQFNEDALTHENSVIDSLREIWSAPVTVSDQAGTAEELASAYQGRVASFRRWLGGIERPFISEMTQELLYIVTNDTAYDQAFVDSDMVARFVGRLNGIPD